MLTPDDEASTVHRVVSGVPVCGLPVPVPVSSPSRHSGPDRGAANTTSTTGAAKEAAGHLAAVSRIEDGKKVLNFLVYLSYK